MKNNGEATIIDILSDSLTDFNGAIGKDANAACDKYLPKIQRCLTSTPGSYLAGEKCSFADIQFYYVVMGKDLSLDAYPKLKELCETVAAIPSLKAYMESDRRYPNPGREGYFDRVKASIPWVFGDYEGEKPAMSSDTWFYKA